MTLEEIEQSMLQSVSDHKLVHIRTGYIDCDAALLHDAWKQIKTAVTLCKSGIEDPKNVRAETILLMLLQEASFHGYTPNSHRAKE